MEFYSALKENEIMISAGKWIDLESIKTGHPHPERQILQVLSGIQILAIPIDRRWDVGTCHETRKGAMRKKRQVGEALESRRSKWEEEYWGWKGIRRE